MLEPAYRWVPDYAETYGDIAADVGERLGRTMDAEQCLILDAIYAENEPGRPTCFEVGAVAPRQNLKTAVFEVAAITDVFVLEVPLHLWTAHLFDTAQRAFSDMVELIDGSDDFRRQVKRIRTANGDEAIELLNGCAIEFHARSKGGARGLTGDKITWDEALYLTAAQVGAQMPILATRPGAQVRYGSSAGVVESGQLRTVRDRGRRGGDPRLAWFEWCAPRVECMDPSCSHMFGEVDGCAADRVDLLKLANPAYGRRIMAETLQDFRRAMPPEEFFREFLGWWDEPNSTDAAFGLGKWDACYGEPPLGVKVGAIGFATTMDLTHGAVVAAGFDGERVHVKPLQHGPGVGWMVQRAKDLQNRHRVDVVVDGRGPAAALIPHLEGAGVRVQVVDTRWVLDACATILDLVRELKLRHAKYPELETAVAGAVRRLVGDRWAWGRKVSTSDISTLEAGTLAAHAVYLPIAEVIPPATPLVDAGVSSAPSDSFDSMGF